MNPAELVDAYRRRPQLAAKRIQEHQLRALQCMDDGNYEQAVMHWDRVDIFNAVLDELVRCRRCGRQLTNPESVARRIGPECVQKSPVAGCPICGGNGTMAVPDPVLGDYIDVNCFCKDRVRSDNGVAGEVAPVPVAPTTYQSGVT